MPRSTSSINYQLGSLYSVITAFLYATQEPFSFPAARHLNTLQFVFLTQIALLVSIPFLTLPPPSRRDFLALMIVGTIVASAVGRVFYQISLTVTGGDNGF